VKTYEFSTKLHNRTNAAGKTVEKVRVWLEESTNNRFLSDAGFKRGAAVEIVIDKGDNSISGEITIKLSETGNKKVAGKADRALFDITRNSDQMPATFHPKNNPTLVAYVQTGLITIKVKGW
jgi:hypothetical protein